MIIAIDIETKGLDATQYVYGCLIKEKTKKPEFYKKKEDLWNRILEIAYKEAKRDKMTNVYSHNAQYDTAGYVDLEDKHLIFFSNRPFIWGYALTIEECEEKGIKYTKTEKEKGKKEIIKFLDTMSIFKGSLKSLGEMINLPKLEMPKYLETGEFNITENKLKEIEPYLERDTEIVMKSIMYLKEILIKEDVKIKRLYTINQIAIQYVINKLKKMNYEEIKNILKDKEKGEVHETYRSEEIHASYRGGRVEAFRTGEFKEVTYIDCNSLYPYIIMNMEIPDLKSERKTWKPLEKRKKEEIIREMGISRCLIYNNKDDLGILGIRTQQQNYFPKSKTWMIGTWTHEELRQAENEGYEIIDIEWTVNWKTSNNPFKKIYEELYISRINTKTQIENWFYKMMMNASIGKMAQHRINQEIVIDDVDEATNYLKKNYEMIKGIGRRIMYKTTKNEKKKKYYMPIIASLVNANARIKMYHELKKIDKKDIIYTDTDSIIFKGKHLDKYEITKNLGDFKIEKENATAYVYGRKTYSINEEIKISGFNQRNMDIEDFKKGIVKAKQMITIKTTNNLKEVGKFKEEIRDLKIQKENSEKNKELIESQRLMIDYDINDISFFFKHFEKMEIENEQDIIR